MHGLARRGLALVQRTRDLVVLAPEDVAKQEGRPLLGRKALEQHQECHGKIRRELAPVIGREPFFRDRFGKPGTGVERALRLGVPQPVDGQARRHLDQPRLRLPHPRAAGALQAEQRVLDQVLGFVHIAEHPERNAEEARPVPLEP